MDKSELARICTKFPRLNELRLVCEHLGLELHAKDEPESITSLAKRFAKAKTKAAYSKLLKAEKNFWNFTRAIEMWPDVRPEAFADFRAVQIWVHAKAGAKRSKVAYAGFDPFYKANSAWFVGHENIALMPLSKHEANWLKKFTGGIEYVDFDKAAEDIISQQLSGQTIVYALSKKKPKAFAYGGDDWNFSKPLLMLPCFDSLSELKLRQAIDPSNPWNKHFLQ